MTSDPSLTRRVTRLENDTESIYELLTEVRSAQEAHTRRVDRIETTLTEVRSAQEAHTRRFDRIESTLTEVLRRLPTTS
jgi:chromosome segregation ATPase